MDKQQVLDNLYALRAGLSVISQEYDKAQAIEDECSDRLLKNADELDKSFACHDHYSGYNDLNKFNGLQNLRKRYGYIDRYQEKIENGEIQPDETVNATHSWIAKINENNLKEKKAYAQWLADDESTEFFQKNLADAQNNKEWVASGMYDNHWARYKQNSKKSLKLSITFFVFAALFAVITVVACLLYGNIIKQHSSGAGSFVYFLPAIYLAPVTLIFLILGIVFICKAKSNKQAHNYEVEKEDTAILLATQMLNLLPETRENARAILRQRDEKITPIKESCNDFYMALRKQFSALLDERDWQNLDLVIFELETRRADTVKEALQLVDRELQTERIQQTIASATEQICYEIRRGFAEIKQTIVECSRVISAQLSVVSLQLGEISGQLSELCDSVNMSNALQAKANVTSAQLLSDVHAIRYYQ